jgi:hypothetical protein
VEGLHLGVGDLYPGWVGVGIEFGVHAQAGRVVVAAMLCTMTSWLVRGRPRQFMEMRENNRCSILFHFEVPGGRWQTVIRRPVSAARAASSVFQSRVR